MRLNEKLKNKGEWLLVFFGVAATASVIYFYYLEIKLGLNVTGVFFAQDSLGQFGDFFGGTLNPIIGCVSAYFLYKNLQVSKELNSASQKQIYTQHVSSMIYEKLARLRLMADAVIKESATSALSIHTFENNDGQVFPSDEKLTLYEFCHSIANGNGGYFRDAFQVYEEWHTESSPGIDRPEIEVQTFLKLQTRLFFSQNILYFNFKKNINSCCLLLNNYLDTVGDKYSFLAEEFLIELADCLFFKDEHSYKELALKNLFYFLLEDASELGKLLKKCSMDSSNLYAFLKEGEASTF